MPANTSSRALGITTAKRRRSLTLAYVNGALWGTGSGLASVTLVVYLAREYNATGFAISCLIAAPAFAGMLRLLTPLWLDRVGSRREFCIRMFLASAVVLFALPIISAPLVLPVQAESMAALAITWAGYHVLEYMGAVALWSWFGDLAPRAIRGRFVGRRQAWTNAGKVVGMVAAAVGTYVWYDYCKATEQLDRNWMSYACCGLAGAVFFALSAWPLAHMADLPLHAPDQTSRVSLRHQLLSPWTDHKFRRLLYFGLWFSFSNGLMQTAQRIFQMNVLGMTFVEKKTLDSGSRGIQSLLMPWVGNWVDRHGNVTVLAISQGMIALAPLFFLIASPSAPWWILGAYFCWLAYAGENVTQPNLMLGLSPRGETAAYASAWYAWTQLAYSVTALVGGALYDGLAAHFEAVSFGGLQIDHFAVLFLTSCLLKLIGVIWAARIKE